MAGDAKLLAMSCTKGNGKAVVEELRGLYNKSSAAKLCTRIINFVNLTKQGRGSVESHSTKWAEELRQLELQGMPLPAISQCCLFLMSLGPSSTYSRQLRQWAPMRTSSWTD
jgi:hypothetical protein